MERRLPCFEREGREGLLCLYVVRGICTGYKDEGREGLYLPNVEVEMHCSHVREEVYCIQIYKMELALYKSQIKKKSITTFRGQKNKALFQ